jgi:hypothetical protein
MRWPERPTKMKSEPPLPSEEDVRFYETHGYFVTGKIFPDEMIEEALYGVQRYYRGERDYVLPISGGFLDWREEHGECLRINDYVSLQNEELRKLVAWPLLGQFAAILSRAVEIRLFHDQLICKPPTDDTSTSIGWHIDRSYWNTCSSDKMLTAWIPLAAYDVEMGPLMIIDESHLWQGNEWMTTFGEHDLETIEAQINTANGEIRKVSIAIKPGQVSFHNGATIHGSCQNRGNQARIALTVHFQDGENRYRPYTDRVGRQALHMNDVLCRKLSDGTPDYSDPDICAVLWPVSP